MEKYGLHASGGRILVVEDDQDARDLIAHCLVPEYLVVATMNGEEAVGACRQVRFDMAIVDVRLPDTTGIDLVPRMQSIDPGMPIILMTAFPRSSDAFWAGNTRGVVGYVEKPFSPWELRKRVQEILAAGKTERWLHLNDLVIDCAARQVLRGGQWLPLTRQEVSILICIARAGQNGQIVGYAELIQAVWGCDPSRADVELVRVTIARLRQKLNDDPRRPCYFETVRGAGYRALPAGGADQL